MSSHYRAVLSPCTGVCTLAGDGLCDGCLRTSGEIANWTLLEDDARLRLMDEILPARAQRRAPSLHPLAERGRLARALHPLSRIPAGPGWNHEELSDLLPAGVQVEAAVLVGLVPRNAGTQVLLTRRNDGLRHHGGQVSFPGGRIEPFDCDVIAAAMRESHEEIALHASQVEPLGFLDAFTTISGFRVVPVVALIDPGYVAQPDPSEVAEVFEVPLDYLMAPASLRRMQVQYQGRDREVLEYDYPAQRIWGATAAILWNLRQRLAVAA